GIVRLQGQSIDPKHRRATAVHDTGAAAGGPELRGARSPAGPRDDRRRLRDRAAAGSQRRRGFEQIHLMIAPNSHFGLPDHLRVVITGVGLTSPNGNSLREYRESLLAGKSGVTKYEIRY